MPETLLNPSLADTLAHWLEWFSTPSFKTVELAVVTYLGLLWLSIIIWVTRDAIHRSRNLFFQVFAILLNLFFPILGTLLYLIVRPSKTTLERYYEELEHRLILESIQKDDTDEDDTDKERPLKRKPLRKLPKRAEEQPLTNPESQV